MEKADVVGVAGGVPAGREVNCQTKEEERDHHPETNGDSK